MMKIIIFGAGETGKDAYLTIKKEIYFSDEVTAFSDNNPLLWGKNIDGIDILSVDDAIQKNPDLFVICSIYHKQIKEQLLKHNIPSNRILLFNTYKYRCYVEWKYKKRYGANPVSVNSAIKHEHVVVYTAITGNYDNLHDPICEPGNIDYVCFTNNKSLKSKVWNIEYVSDDELSDILLAKKYKLHPEKYFREYETSVWIDGKFEIRGNATEYILAYAKTEPMLCFSHPERNCIYDEAAECIIRGVGKKDDIIRQITHYYSECFPFDYGLYEMGCIVRKHNDERVVRLMNLWEDEIRKYSYRDQLSFPYVCRLLSFTPDISDVYINDNKYFTYIPHNHENISCR